MTSNISYSIILEQTAHALAIEALHESVFGPGRFARTAFRVREGCVADPRFCFAAFQDEGLIGSVRLTDIMVGAGRAYLLGPLCVAKPVQGLGIGRALVRQAVDAVMKLEKLPVLLVGDAPYYAPLGFELAPSSIKMPGPVDYARLLIVWPQANIDRKAYNGVVRGLSALPVPHGGESAEQKSQAEEAGKQ